MITLEVKGKTLTWTLDGEGVFPAVRLKDIESVSADGRELVLILTGFTGIPRANTLSQVWVGDFARQIVANLGAVIAAGRDPGRAKPGTAVMD